MLFSFIWTQGTRNRMQGRFLLLGLPEYPAKRMRVMKACNLRRLIPVPAWSVKAVLSEAGKINAMKSIC
ncbi:hypothetical protein ACFFP0_19750 [Rhizobium puerariae]|uniref:Uncharacterized protein n=1 Tax=Rhizobium puerariae TaxID=1585791 RepID=A0ABV6AKL1_9HYPH